MIVGGILAGGLGTRMADGGLPKQFLMLGDMPVIIRTIKKFMRISEIEHIIIAINKDWKEYCEDLLKEYQIYSQNIHVIYGGETRFDSLLCLADACKTLGKDENDIILINHDCARPFVSERILKDNLKMIQRYDMVTTSVPTIDTVLLSEDGICSKEVPERSTVFLDQGPQTLRVDQFLAIVDMLTPKEKEKYMEAGRLYLDKGYRMGIVKGERENFKITTKFDLSLAELILKQGENL